MHSSRLQSIAVATLVVVMVAMAFAVTAPSVRANHDTIPWSDAYLVNSVSGYTDSFPWVVADGHGDIYVFYVSTYTASGTSNVSMTKFQAVGPFGVPAKLFDAQVNDVPSVVSASYPISATIDHAGNLYVAWTGITSTLGMEVYVSKSSDGGTTWQPAVRANAPNAAGGDFWPSIATTPEGTVYVAWIQNWNGVMSVSASKSANGGTSFGSWTNVTSTGILWSASLATDAQGRVYLAYSPYDVGVGNYAINVTWSDDGTTWSTATTLTSSQYPGFFPALAVGSAGTVQLSWYSAYGVNYVIRSSQSTNRGLAWSTPVAITQPTPGGYIGYMATEGDTLMYVWGSFANGGSLGYVISADQGSLWYPEENVTLGTGGAFTSVAADQNGTFWAAYPSGTAVYFRFWNGPPSEPVITSVAAVGTSGLRVRWNAVPEQDVAAYQIWVSQDGSTYQLAGTVSGSATSFTDSGLTNGTYWYKVVAVDNMGTPSHASAPMSGTVGPTTQELIDALNAQIAALQAQLSDAQANLSALQTQITNLRNQLSILQNSQAAANAATQSQLANLQANLTNLQNQLNSLKDAQATQIMSYLILALLIVVIVLLVALLARKPRPPVQMMAPMPGAVAPPPSSPPAPPRESEDEL